MNRITQLLTIVLGTIIIGFTANAQLTVTGGDLIVPNNNVGIGTDSGITEKLTVMGNILLRDDGGSKHTLIRVQGSNTNIQSERATTSKLRLETPAGGGLTVWGQGGGQGAFVGIGTDDPTAKLEIAGLTNSVAVRLSAKGGGDNVPLELLTKANNGSTSTARIYGAAGSAAGDNYLIFSANSGDTHMELLPSGGLNLKKLTGSRALTLEANGGGDSVPLDFKIKANNNAASTARIYGAAGSAAGDNSLVFSGNSVDAHMELPGDGGLNVNKLTNSRTVTLAANVGGDNVPLDFSIKANNGAASTAAIFGAAGSGASDNFLSLSGGGGHNHHLSIMSSGRVGIGTTNPGSELHVEGEVRASLDGYFGHFQLRNSGNRAMIQNNSGTNLVEINDNFRVDGTLRIGGGASAATDALQIENGSIRLSDSYQVQWGNSLTQIKGSNNNFLRFFTNSNAVPRMVIQGSDVGIGTTAPTTRLDVDGNARVRQLSADDSLDSIVVADADGVLHIRTVASVAAMGAQGPQGEPGAAGTAGTAGAQGPQGKQGPAGQDASSECVACSEAETVTFEAVCEIFEGDISNTSEVANCVTVIANLILINADVCAPNETDCLSVILGNVQDLIDSKTP